MGSRLFSVQCARCGFLAVLMLYWRTVYSSFSGTLRCSNYKHDEIGSLPALIRGVLFIVSLSRCVRDARVFCVWVGVCFSERLFPYHGEHLSQSAVTRRASHLSAEVC